MAMINIGQWEIDESELEQQHKEAVERGRQRINQEPQVKRVEYENTTRRFIIVLKNDVQFSIPIALIQGLASASAEEIADVRIGPRGASLHWERLDVDLSVTGLLAGIFGTRLWMSSIGRQGGGVTSSAKQEASRLNGKKGGRPKRSLMPEVV